MKLKLAASLVAASIGFAGFAAEACTSSRIAGWWEITVVQTTFDRFGSGAPVFAVDFDKRSTLHTTCQFEVGRMDRNTAWLNVHCDEGWVPWPHVGTGEQHKPTPAPFMQDGLRFSSGDELMFPWHQLHRRDGCIWEIVDLNEIDATYRVAISTNGQSLTGSGAKNGYGESECYFCNFVTTFNGVKVRRARSR